LLVEEEPRLLRVGRDADRVALRPQQVFRELRRVGVALDDQDQRPVGVGLAWRGWELAREEVFAEQPVGVRRARAGVELGLDELELLDLVA